MKLRINEGSPFARKVRIFSREKGLLHRLEEGITSVSPIETSHSLVRENPLSKIPVLVLENGEALYDSGVICEYLDTLHNGERSFPTLGFERFKVLRAQALCDGILDSAVLCRYELALRPASLRWDDWIEGQKRKIYSGLSVLEAEASCWSDDFDIVQIGTVCALGYLDFRLGDWDWRGANPRLRDWYSGVSHRPSVSATGPRVISLVVGAKQDEVCQLRK